MIQTLLKIYSPFPPFKMDYTYSLLFLQNHMPFTEGFVEFQIP